MHFPSAFHCVRTVEVPLYTCVYMCAHVYIPVSFTVQSGITPLHAASCEGHTEVVKILLESGADPHLRNMVGGLVCLYLTFLWHVTISQS